MWCSLTGKFTKGVLIAQKLIELIVHYLHASNSKTFQILILRLVSIWIVIMAGHQDMYDAMNIFFCEIYEYFTQVMHEEYSGVFKLCAFHDELIYEDDPDTLVPQFRVFFRVVNGVRLTETFLIDLSEPDWVEFFFDLIDGFLYIADWILDELTTGTDLVLYPDVSS